jgi:hypothetical protein
LQRRVSPAETSRVNWEPGRRAGPARLIIAWTPRVPTSSEDVSTAQESKHMFELASTDRKSPCSRTPTCISRDATTTRPAELKHLNPLESNFHFDDWTEALADHKVQGMVVRESPNRDDDTLMIKKLYLAQKDKSE